MARFEWEKSEPKIAETYFSVIRSAYAEPGLTRKEVIKLGREKCEELGLLPQDKDKELPHEDSNGIPWMKNHKTWKKLWDAYKGKNLLAQEQPFTLAILNQYPFLINGSEQMKTVQNAMMDLTALDIVPTVRVIKWTARFSTHTLSADDTFLSTTGFGSMSDRWKDHSGRIHPHKLGALDLGQIYADKEREELQGKSDISWDSSELDAKFFSPVFSQIDKNLPDLKYSLPWSHPLVDHFLKRVNKERKNLGKKYRDDESYRHDLYMFISKIKKPLMDKE
jgi:hypothetical protein